MILSFAENGLVAGAFVYLLHNFMTKFSTTLDRIANTMESMDKRMLSLELRMESLENSDNEERTG